MAEKANWGCFSMGGFVQLVDIDHNPLGEHFPYLQSFSIYPIVSGFRWVE